MDGWIDGSTDKWTKDWMNTETNEWIEWMNIGTNDWMKEERQVGRKVRMNTRMNQRMDE